MSEELFLSKNIVGLHKKKVLGKSGWVAKEFKLITFGIIIIKINRIIFKLFILFIHSLPKLIKS